MASHEEEMSGEIQSSQTGGQGVMAAPVQNIDNPVVSVEQCNEPVSKQINPSKKRSLSEHDESDISNSEISDRSSKKHKTQQEGDVYIDNDMPAMHDLHVDNKTVYNMFRTLSDQVQTLYTDLTKRIVAVEENLELKLTQKLKCALDSRFETELNSVRSEIKDQLSVVKKDVETRVSENMTKVIDTKTKKETEKVRCGIEKELKTVNKRVDGLVNKCNDLKEDLRGVRSDLANRASYAGAVSGSSGESEENIVVKMLPEREREAEDSEITKNCVAALIRDGLRLSDVRVVSAERKKGSGRNPGVVIARVESREQKQKIMKNKSKLRKTRNYDKVYIEDETPRDVRNNEANLRTILREIGCTRDYVVKHGKLQRKFGSDRNQGDGHRDDNGRDAWRAGGNRSDRRTGADQRRFSGGRSR